MDTGFSVADEERSKPKDEDSATLCESKHGMGTIGNPISSNKGPAGAARNLDEEPVGDSKSLEEGRRGAHG